MSTSPPSPAPAGPDPGRLQDLIDLLGRFIDAVEWVPGRPVPPRMIARGLANRLDGLLLDLGFDPAREEYPYTTSWPGPVSHHGERLLEDLAGIMSRTGLVLVDGRWRQPVASNGSPLLATPIEVRRLRDSRRGLAAALAVLRGEDTTPEPPPRRAPPSDPLEDVEAAVLELVALAEVEDRDLGSVDPYRRLAISEAFREFDLALGRFRARRETWRDRPGGRDLELRCQEAADISMGAQARGGWHYINDHWFFRPDIPEDSPNEPRDAWPLVRVTPAEAGSLLQFAARAREMRIRIRAEGPGDAGPVGGTPRLDVGYGAIQLYGQENPPIVAGRAVKRLFPGQYQDVRALVLACINLREMEGAVDAVGTSDLVEVFGARKDFARTFRNLRGHSEAWEFAIIMPGEPWGGHRIATGCLPRRHPEDLP